MKLTAQAYLFILGIIQTDCGVGMEYGLICYQRSDTGLKVNGKTTCPMEGEKLNNQERFLKGY